MMGEPPEAARGSPGAAAGARPVARGCGPAVAVRVCAMDVNPRMCVAPPEAARGSPGAGAGARPVARVCGTAVALRFFAMDVTPRLFVEIHPFDGPHSPHPHPVEEGRFDPKCVYKVLGVYNPSE